MELYKDMIAALQNMIVVLQNTIVVPQDIVVVLQSSIAVLSEHDCGASEHHRETQNIIVVPQRRDCGAPYVWGTSGHDCGHSGAQGPPGLGRGLGGGGSSQGPFS